MNLYEHITWRYSDKTQHNIGKKKKKVAFWWKWYVSHVYIYPHHPQPALNDGLKKFYVYVHIHKTLSHTCATNTQEQRKWDWEHRKLDLWLTDVRTECWKAMASISGGNYFQSRILSSEFIRHMSSKMSTSSDKQGFNKIYLQMFFLRNY